MSGFFSIGEGFVYDWDEDIALMIRNDELSFDREFMSGEAHSFCGDFFRNASHFEEHATRFNDSNPIFWGAFTGSHTSFGWFCSYGLVRENFNPDLSAAANITSQVIRRKLDGHLVAWKNSDKVHADFAGNVRSNFVVVF